MTKVSNVTKVYKSDSGDKCDKNNKCGKSNLPVIVHRNSTQMCIHNQFDLQAKQLLHLDHPINLALKYTVVRLVPILLFLHRFFFIPFDSFGVGIYYSFFNRFDIIT